MGQEPVPNQLDKKAVQKGRKNWFDVMIILSDYLLREVETGQPYASIHTSFVPSPQAFVIALFCAIAKAHIREVYEKENIST